jgi:hypothetical protein
MTTKFLVVLSLLLAIADVRATENCEQHGLATGRGGWCVPHMRLNGDLSKIFTINDCAAISGLTCRIKYNGKMPLPSEVFFIEFDRYGKALGKATRLIYPRLRSGKSGVATFRILTAHATTIELTAKWNGPWKDPY